jgi:MFS family permease
MMSRHPKFFYGWWIVVVAATGLFFGFAPIIVYSFGVFLKPLTQELHSNRASISLAFTLSSLMAAVSSPLVGWLADRFGTRRVILVSTVIFGLLLISSPLLPLKLWIFYVFYGLLGFVGSGAAPIPYLEVVTRWFDRHRGLALGLAMSGIGSGAVLVPALAQKLIAIIGWRSTYAVAGLLVLVVSIPIVGIFLKNSPQEMDLLPDGGTLAKHADKRNIEDGLTWPEARRSLTFWLLVGAIFLVSSSVHGCVIHLAPMLTDQGASPRRVALATSILGTALLLARVGSGYLLDRFFAPHVAACFFGAAACGIALLRTGAGSGLVFPATFLIGLGMGAEGDIIAYLTSRYFGLRSFGEIYGYAFASFLLAGALGPWLMGLGFDRSGSYGLILVVFLLACLFAAFLISRIGPYRFRPA